MLCKTCVRRTQGYNNCLLNFDGTCKRYRSETAELIASKCAEIKKQAMVAHPREQVQQVLVDPFAFMRA